MSKVLFDAGLSLDGYFAGDNRGPQNPLGDRGTAIHSWMYQQKAFWEFLGMDGGKADDEDGVIIRDTFQRTGAYIMGKRMFDEGEANWPNDLYKTAVYVVTHEKREPWVQEGSTTFYFVNDGVESALKKAKEAAKGKDIRIQGGADTIQQFLNAGLVDEFVIHITPIVIGSGIRLFDNIDKNKFKVELVKTVPSPLTTHIFYELKNK
jgi:dihydrofolate reductase